MGKITSENTILNTPDQNTRNKFEEHKLSVNTLHDSLDTEVANRQSAISQETTNRNTALSFKADTATVAAGLMGQGAWNASTNTPTLSATPLSIGKFYEVSVAGTSSIPTGGSVLYSVGDKLVSNGTVWQHIPVGYGYYGPYNSVALACAAVPSGNRSGKTVGVITDGVITEYIWHPSNLTDVGLTKVFPITETAAEKNLANPAEVTTGTFISNTGTVTANVNYFVTGFVPVTALVQYVCSAQAVLTCYYDSNKNVVAGGSPNVITTFTIPSGVAYVRASFLNAALATLQIEQGSVATAYTPFVIGYIEKINNKGLLATTLKTDAGNVTPDQLLAGTLLKSQIEGVEPSVNLVDPIEFVTGYVILPDGSVLPNYPNHFYTGYVPVIAGQPYKSNVNMALTCYYDVNKNVVAGGSSGVISSFTPPATVCFIRGSVGIASIASFQIQKGTVATAFEAYNIGRVEKIGDKPLVATLIKTDEGNKTAAQLLAGIPQAGAEAQEAYTADVYMIPCYGQSLAINTQAGTSTFTAPVSIAYDKGLANTNIQDMNGGYAEMFLALSKEFQTLPANFKLMTCVNGGGGQSVLQLSKGTSYYAALISSIQTGKTNATANGLTYNVPAFVYTQGEEDMRAGGTASNYGTGNFNPLLYATKLKQLIDDLNTDIKAITLQTNDVKCVMYQVASHNAYGRYPRIAIEQLKLAIADDRVSLAKAMYEADYDATDQVHAPAKTYRNMGNHYGIALFNAIAKKERVLPIVPAQHYFVGNDLYIKFHVPVKPLVLDTTIVSALPDGNYVFNLVTVTNETAGATGTIALATQTITAVTLLNADTVKITLSAIPPAGTRLTYGVNGDGWNAINGTAIVGYKSGRTSGARGNLRDSRTYINPVSNYFTLHNWCPIFEIVL